MDDVGTMRTAILMVRHAAGGHPRGPTPGQAVAAMRALREVVAVHADAVQARDEPTQQRLDREHRAILAAIRAIGDGPFALAEAHGAAMLLRDHLLWEERALAEGASTGPDGTLEAARTALPA